MIKINLAEMKVSSVSGGAGLTQSFNLGKLDFSVLKEVPIQKLLVPLAIAIAANYGLGIYEDSEIKKISVEVEAINAQKPKLEADAGKMKSYEELKKGMEGDEFIIRNKLETIRALIQNRGDSAKYLVDLANLTPPTIWLTGFTYDGTTFNIQGSTLSFKQISPFLKALTQNPAFQDLTLKDSQSVKDPKLREIVTFNLRSGEKK